MKGKYQDINQAIEKNTVINNLYNKKYETYDTINN